MTIRVIPTRVHGMLDYATGPVLLAAPELFGLKDVRRSAVAPRVAGAGTTAYSLVTDYELGAVRRLPMRAHLALDAIGGSLLAGSPWLFRTARHGKRYWLPHTLVGTIEVLVAALTRTEPSRRRRLGDGRRLVPAIALSSGVLASLLVARRRGVLGAAKERAGGDGADDAVFASDGMASTGADGGDTPAGGTAAPPVPSETPAGVPTPR